MSTFPKQERDTALIKEDKLCSSNKPAQHHFAFVYACYKRDKTAT